MFSLSLRPFFRWFETRNEVFELEQPVCPPTDLWGFIKYYAWPFRWMIVACTLASAVVALLEVMLYSYLGTLVDWLAKADRTTFWSDHGSGLIAMAFVVLMLLPAVKLLNEALVNQGLMGNFAMRNRWQAHRYLLRQSMSFFQNDFRWPDRDQGDAERSVGVRDVVLKFAEILNYVIVYFLAARLSLFAASDHAPHRPARDPLARRLYCRPFALLRADRLGQISMEQADAPLDGDGAHRRQLHEHRRL